MTELKTSVERDLDKVQELYAEIQARVEDTLADDEEGELNCISKKTKEVLVAPRGCV